MNNVKRANEILTGLDVNITSSSKMLIDFDGSFIHKDIMAFLDNLISNTRDEIEAMGIGTGYQPDEIPYSLAFCQGQLYQARIFKDIVTILLTLKEEDEDGPVE